MKRTFRGTHIFVAVVMIAIMLLCIPSNIISEKTSSEEKPPLAQNQNVSSQLNAKTEKETTTSAPETTTVKEEKETENTTKSSEKFTAVSPVAEVKNISTAKNGEIYVPATLNNVMLDNLSSMVTKKIYTFSITARGAVKYAFNHKEVTKDSCLWYITLYEEYSPDGTKDNVAYRVLNRASYDTVGIGVQSSSIGVLPGNYRVEVECVSGFTDKKYQIGIGFAETALFETEPNNSLSRYTELPLNKTINGGASVLPNGNADTDCYLFRITENGYTVLSFRHADDPNNIKDNVAWRIKLSDANGKEYFYTTSAMESSDISSGIMGLPPGYYYVTVSSHMFSNIEYSLNVSFTKDSNIETELNDSQKTADTITVNTEKKGSLTSRYNASDKDYFVFTMQKDGFAVIDFMHDEIKETKDGWNVSVLSSDGKLIYSATSKWDQAIMQTPNIGLNAGKYYIKIDSDNLYHNSMTYRLAVLSVQEADWETESNNSPDNADVIKLNKPINGTLVENGVNYDKDWFKISTSEKTKVTVSFSHTKIKDADKEGWIVSLVDVNGNIIKTVTSDWDTAEVSFSANLDAGSYYVLVETGLYFNSSRYVLTVK